MSDIIIGCGVEYPESQASVEIELRRPNGETIVGSPDQRIRLDRFIENETIQVSARLKGTSRITPFLFNGVQIVEGELQTSADYVTRAVIADGADRVSSTMDVSIPSGATLTVEIGVPDDWSILSPVKTTPLGDGRVEQVYERKPYAPIDARTRLTLTGTPAARPQVSQLRMVTTEF